MANSEAQMQLNPDAPIQSSAEDVLGFTPFAEHLAKAFATANLKDGFVVAIFGPWGSGKTSFLNLLRGELKNANPQKISTVNFNPWWFSGQDLTIRFFRELAANLSNDARMKNLRTSLLAFAGAISPILSGVPYVGNFGESLERITKLLGEAKSTTEEQKNALAKKLRESDTKIVVFIDDIDRLSVGEVRELFQLIKAVADLPNVIYLLAFDRKFVVNALEDVQRISGSDYLEKIVQASFELPTPDSGTLQGLFLSKLETIVRDSSERGWQQQYWTELYRGGLRHLIATPREVALLTNSISLSLPAVDGEVNTADFIALECLRLTCRVAYEAIRSHGEMFSGHIATGLGGTNVDELKNFHNNWLEQIDSEQRVPIRSLLQSMFPKLTAVWSNMYYDYEPSWRRDLRICAPDVFPVYFRMGVPSDYMSASDVIGLISNVNSAEEFAKILIDMAEE